MSQFKNSSISVHKNKSNYDAKQKKFKNSLANLQSFISNEKNEDTSVSQRKISKAQTYRLLNCIKVLEYLKDYEIQPCNERICRALKQYGKNKENICKLWEQVLSFVNNKKEAINSILVKNIWLQMNNCNTNTNNNINNDYYNNCKQEQMNNNPIHEKCVTVKEYNYNNMNNNILVSNECKPMFLDNTYINNNNNNIFNNENSSSNSSTSDEYNNNYPALYKPAWTISLEQLRNANKSISNNSNNNNNNNNNNNYNNYNNVAKQYPSPISSPTYNSYYNF
ncbi:hypothetical protein U3516DRAFT_617345 [Neocallimastix sp. 'constans']